jgi:rubrerythrin
LPIVTLQKENEMEGNVIMAVDFKNSQTKENLMRAFAGESQARNRYTLAAGQAKKMNHHIIEQVFRYTADQEKEHAEVFYKFLKEANGETIQIDGGYPVDNYEDVKQLLRSAEHNENEEHDVVYQAFGDKALEEGFTRIGNTFHQIAKVEKTHAMRFARFAELLEQGKLYESDQMETWVCLNCGYVYEGKEAPKVCPVCEHAQGYFVRSAMAPYGNGVY